MIDLWKSEYNYICRRKTEEHEKILKRVAFINRLLFDFLTEKGLITEWIERVKNEQQRSV